MQANILEIIKTLPHNYPFLLVDRIEEMHLNEEGKGSLGISIKAIKNVTFNEPFFQGHFPGNPIMPGVLIIEAMAQVAALVSARPRADGKKWNFYIAGVDKARFRKPVTPGDQLVIDVSCIRDRGKLYIFRCEARVDGAVCAEAEIMAKMF